LFIFLKCDERKRKRKIALSAMHGVPVILPAAIDVRGAHFGLARAGSEEESTGEAPEERAFDDVEGHDGSSNQWCASSICSNGKKRTFAVVKGRQKPAIHFCQS